MPAARKPLVRNLFVVVVLVIVAGTTRRGLSDDLPLPALPKKTPQKATPAQVVEKNRQAQDDQNKAKEAAARKPAEEIQKRANQAQQQALQKQMQAQIQARVAQAKQVAILRMLGSQTSGSPLVFPEDRNTMRQLRLARNQLENKLYNDAVATLGRILEAEQDYFFQPDRSRGNYVSIKAEATRLIGGMSTEGLEAYQLRYGITADKLLQQALADGDIAQLALVAGRYFHTQAGYRATVLLAQTYLNRGSPLGAALALERLFQGSGEVVQTFEPMLSVQTAVCYAAAGLSDKALSALQRLEHVGADLRVSIAGREVPLSATGPAARLAWLRDLGGPGVEASSGNDEWLLVGGNPARNASSSGSSPLLNLNWRAPFYEDPRVEKLLELSSKQYAQMGASPLPAAQPLAVDGLVLMRTATHLVAVDFETGRREWEAFYSDQELQDALGKATAKPANPPQPKKPQDDPQNPFRITRASPGVSPEEIQRHQVLAGLGRRVWADSTYGAMSSDGQQVFVVEELGFGQGAPNVNMRVMVNGRMMRSTGIGKYKAYNTLAAYELRSSDGSPSGLRMWELGGGPGAVEAPLAGAFFLGPPLPLGGRLYAVAEVKSEIRLLAIHPETGQVEWMQTLGSSEQSVLHDSNRQTAGASPSYADGVLVCPTGAGAVVAVDLTSRSLLWGVNDLRTDNSTPQRRNINMIVAAGGMLPGVAQGWQDNRVVLADGRVLLTPDGSNSLHCLNLTGGQVHWKHPRADGIYLAGVYSGVVIVVGEKSVRGLKLADGSIAWSTSLPDGARPSGRGYLQGDRYHVPLTTAEVATLELERGRIVNRAKSRSGQVPGNLICYRNTVVSQTATSVDAFYDMEHEKRRIQSALESNPQDPANLLRRAAVRLHQGDRSGAIVDLQHSLKLASDNLEARQLLFDALCEGLREDFPTYHKRTDELQALAATPEMQAQYLRLLAIGFLESGRRLNAAKILLRLAFDLESYEDLALIPVPGDRKLSLHRWIGGKLAEILTEAVPEERQQLISALDERIAASDQDSPAALEQLLRVYTLLPQAQRLRLALVRQYQQQASPPAVALEAVLRVLEMSPSAEVRGQAVAELASLFEKRQDWHAAAWYYERLRDEFPTQAFASEKTGRELAAAYFETSANKLLAPVWPTGQVHSSEKPGVQRIVQQAFAERPEHSEGYWDRLTFSLESAQHVARDRLGRVQWTAAMPDGEARNAAAGLPAAQSVATAGHIAIWSTGRHVAAFDTLDVNSEGKAKHLWTHAVYVDSQAAATSTANRMARALPTSWGGLKTRLYSAQNQSLSSPAAVTCGSQVCFLRDNELVCVDARSGEDLWVRGDIAAAAQLQADDESIYVAALDSGKVRLFRAEDGAETTSRSIAPWTARMARFGSRVLSWNNAGGKVLVELHDLSVGARLWSREFNAQAKAALVGSRQLGVMDPSGYFALLDLDDGSVHFDTQLAAQAGLANIYLFPSRERLLLATSAQAGRRAVNGLIGIQRAGNNRQHAQAVNGWVYALDPASGRGLWEQQVQGLGLPLVQPADSPLLVFVTAATYRQQRGRRFTLAQRTAVAMLDKRSGRVVNRHTFNTFRGSDYRIDLDAEKSTVGVSTGVGQVTAQLTEDAWPAETAEPELSLAPGNNEQDPFRPRQQPPPPNRIRRVIPPPPPAPQRANPPGADE